jgi:hypothetical protein
VPIVLKSGSLDLLEPLRPVQACTAFPATILKRLQYLPTCSLMISDFCPQLRSSNSISHKLRALGVNNCGIFCEMAHYPLGTSVFICFNTGLEKFIDVRTQVLGILLFQFASSFALYKLHSCHSAQLDDTSVTGNKN